MAGGEVVARSPSLLLYEAHGVLADALAAVLEATGIVVVAVVDNPDLAVEAATAVAPDVAVISVGHEPAVELEALPRLRETRSSPPIVVLWRLPEKASMLARLRRFDPQGFVSASARAEDLTSAVHSVLRGQRYPGHIPIRELRSATESFTPAERRVVVELAKCPDTRARLARRLGVSTSTLDSQLAAIKAKVSEELAISPGLPIDGFLSTEALIGWAIDQGFHYG